MLFLQRLQRLLEKQQEQEQSSEQLQKTSSPSLLPPDYNSSVTPLPSSAIVAEEVTRLRGEYWKQQNRLNLLDAVKPISEFPVQEQMLLRKHRGRHGRSYAWVWVKNDVLLLGDAVDVVVVAVRRC